MAFDCFTAALLVLRLDSPELDEQAENELQDARMAFLADLSAPLPRSMEEVGICDAL
jgi:hypothetical protein